MKNWSRAFTLVELLVVISIIGILAAIVTVSFGPIQKRTRDSKRKADVNSFRSGLDLFYSQFKVYPNFTMFLGTNSQSGAENSSFDFASDIASCAGNPYSSPEAIGSDWEGFATNAQDLNESTLREGFRSVNGLLSCLKFTEARFRDPLTGAVASSSDYQYRVNYNYSEFIILATLENNKDNELEQLFGGSNFYYIQGNGKLNRQFSDSISGLALSSGQYLYQCQTKADGINLTADERSSEIYSPIKFDNSSWILNPACGAPPSGFRIVTAYGIKGDTPPSNTPTAGPSTTPGNTPTVIPSPTQESPEN